MWKKKLTLFKYRISLMIVKQTLLKDPKRVLEEVSYLYGIPVDEILGKRRFKLIVDARHEAMYRMRHELKFTFKHIGDIFSRDHSTIIHAIEKVENERRLYGS